MPPGSDERRRSATSRTATLEATLELIGELPYPKVTVEAIAARAGVSKATIYRWWPSRGAVVVDAIAHRNAVDLDAAYGLPDSGDLERDLAAVLRAIADELADPAWDALLRALTVETLQDAAIADQVLRTVFEPQLAAFARRFEAARAAGQVTDDVDDLAAMELVVAPIFHRWQQRSGPLDHPYADGVARRACRALGPA